MNRRYTRAARSRRMSRARWLAHDSSRREIASMAKDHILSQLHISSWDMVPRKYQEINCTVAAWLKVTVKSLPRLRWYGAYSDEPGSHGMIVGHKQSSPIPPTIYVRCDPRRREILETLFHELLHYYLPDAGEAIVEDYEHRMMGAVGV